MDLLAALFVDAVESRQVEGPSTRLDLLGVQFSGPAAGPLPAPVPLQLVVVVRCAPDEPGVAALEVTFTHEGTELARHLESVQVEPGRFNYRLVTAELSLPCYGAVEARCRLDLGPVVVTPYTVLPPVTGPDRAATPIG